MINKLNAAEPVENREQTKLKEKTITSDRVQRRNECTNEEKC